MTEAQIIQTADRTLEILSDLIQQDSDEPDRFPALRVEQQAQLIGRLGPAIFNALLALDPG